MKQLKSCPFYGGQAKTIFTNNAVYIQCKSCNALMGRQRKTMSAIKGKEYFDNEQEAADAWNRRTK